MDSVGRSQLNSLSFRPNAGDIKAPFQEEQEEQQEGSKDSFDESLRPAEELDPEEEQEEGERHEAELLEKYPLWHDQEAEELLDMLFEQLLPRMARPGVDYDFLALDTDTPFASSCPNGAVYFSRGLLQELSEGELLFFAAHELAHTELRHYATRQRRLADLRQSIPAPVGSPTRQRLDQAAVLSVRHQEEFEADHQAGLWVDRSLAVQALTTLHELCRRTSPKSLQRPTHPPFERRVALLKSGEPFPPILQYLYSLVG